MRELRSLVNACLAFAAFLLLYALFIPGHARGTSNSPRFLRMEVEHLAGWSRHERHTVSVPYFLARSALRFAAEGAVRRELNLQFDREVGYGALRAVWSDLKAAPEGAEIVREHDSQTMTFKRRGDFVTLQIASKEPRGAPPAVMEAAETAQDDESGEGSPKEAPAATPAPTPGEKVEKPPEETGPPRLPGDWVVIRIPVRLVEALLVAERDLDANTLLAELKAVDRGDLIDVRKHDAHVRVWVE